MLIVTDGNCTIVDHNDYNLSLEEAAERLMNKQNVIACEFPDFSADNDFDVYAAQPVILYWYDYKDNTRDEIVDDIRYYEQFGELE